MLVNSYRHRIMVHDMIGRVISSLTRIEIDMHLWWNLIAFAILVVLLAPLVIWRRRQLSYLAGLSLLFLVVLLTEWYVTWNGAHMAAFFWSRPAGGGEFNRTNLALTLMHGGCAWRYDVRRAPVGGIMDNDLKLPSRFILEYGHQEGARYTYPLYRQFARTNKSFVELKLGFQLCWGSQPPNPGTSDIILLRSVTVPIYFPMLFCLIFPAAWIRKRYIVRGRIARGECLICGYPLRASNSKRCPECGTPAGSAPIPKPPETPPPAQTPPV